MRSALANAFQARSTEGGGAGQDRRRPLIPLTTPAYGRAMRSSRRPHILFLNGAESLGADVAVHVSIARSLDRRRVRVSAASNLRESLQGVSAMAAFKSIPDLDLLPLYLGQPLGPRRGLARARALLYNARSMSTLVRLGMWCRRNRVDLVHVTERPRQTLFEIGRAHV